MFFDGKKTLTDHNLGEQLSDCVLDPQIVLLDETFDYFGVFNEGLVCFWVICPDPRTHCVDFML